MAHLQRWIGRRVRRIRRPDGTLQAEEYTEIANTPALPPVQSTHAAAGNPAASVAGCVLLLYVLLGVVLCAAFAHQLWGWFGVVGCIALPLLCLWVASIE
jgi:hypothetical protein